MVFPFKNELLNKDFDIVKLFRTIVHAKLVHPLVIK